MAVDRLTELDDNRLVDAFCAATSKPEADAIFSVICDRHLRPVLRYCAAELRESYAASDAAQETFLAAYQQLGRTRPASLGGWLIGIARNIVYRQFRSAQPGGGPRHNPEMVTATGEIDRPAGESIDDLENLSRRRLAEVERLLDTVVNTLTERQRRLYALAIRDGKRGESLASALGITAKRASTETWNLIQLMENGFGALVLARDGRQYCAQLAAILDAAPTEFTTALRERIVRHFGTCSTCDACTTCERERKRLVMPYTPVVIPILVLGVTRESIDQRVRNAARESSLPPPPAPPQPRSTAPRSAGRRRLLLILTPLLVVIVVAAAALLPRLLTRSDTSAGGPPTSGQPVALAGGDWQIPGWSVQPNPAGNTFGPSTWRIDGSCSGSSPCLLQVVAGNGPDGLYTDQEKAAVLSGSPRELRFSGAGNDYRASTTYPVSCGNSVDDYPMDVADTVDIHVLTSVSTVTGPVANSIAITWTSVTTPGPAAIQLGCTATTFVYQGTATRAG